jgi:uroporphyrinogen-III synthase
VSAAGKGGRAKPLAARTVVLTRPADQSASLAATLRRLGARPIVAPAIEIAPARSAALTRALRDLDAGDFAWITLTSQATVAMLASRLPSPRALGSPRALDGTRVAAIGDGTAAAFRRWARRDPDLVPATFTTTGLARAFPRGDGRVLCARADIAPPGLEDALAAKGWSPTRVDAYRTRMPRTLPREARDALRAGEVDAVTFTSASTVRGFVGAIDAVAGAPKVVCIGPVTAKEARTHGLTVHAVARPHTIEGLVDALVRVLAR